MRDKDVKIGPFRVFARLRNGKPTGSWMVDVPPRLSSTGKRSRISLSSKSAGIVEAKRMLRELQLEGSIRGHGSKPTDVTFAEMAGKWLEEQADRVATGKKRASTLTADGFKLRALGKIFAAVDVAAIGSREVLEYQKLRTIEKRVAPTINGETSLLLQLLRWGQDKGFVKRLPKIENIPVPIKRVDIPTQAEVTRILDALPVRTALLVRFLAETGCRKGEALALEWNDVDEANDLVMIRRKEGFTPKTRHSDRDIPISRSLMIQISEAQEAAREKCAKNNSLMLRWVFPGRGGKQMVDFRKALASAIVSAGVRRRNTPLKLTAHGLRKSMATWLHMQGVSDALLQPRLGHAPGSRVTASTYIQVTTEDMRAVTIDLDAVRSMRENAL